jgi:hypothetical protein
MTQDDKRPRVVIGRVSVAAPGSVEDGVLIETELAGQHLEMAGVWRG